MPVPRERSGSELPRIDEKGEFMMAKRLAILCIVPVLFCFFHPGALPIFAEDDPSYYGDGTSVSWEDLSQYLSPLYRNTPYISVSNGSESRRFSFNIELFTDLGL